MNGKVLKALGLAKQIELLLDAADGEGIGPMEAYIVARMSSECTEFIEEAACLGYPEAEYAS